MNFEEALCAELKTISGLEQKVFPQNAEENTEAPFVVYISSGGEQVQTLDGYTDLTELSFEVNVVAKSYEQLKSFVQAISNKIQSFFGRTIGGSNGIYIKSVSFTEPNEDFQENQSYHKSTFNVRVRF
jgi:hypothetical protein